MSERPIYAGMTDSTTSCATDYTPPVRHPEAWRVRDFYKFWAHEQVRFADLDPLGHVNNNSYGIYAESARVALLSELYPDFWHAKMMSVLKAIYIEYHAELHYPNKVDLGIRVLKIGQSSVALAIGVFAGDLCCATAISTGVYIDRETRRPSSVPDVIRTNGAKYL